MKVKNTFDKYQWRYRCGDCVWFDPCENPQCSCGICSRYVAEGDADYTKVSSIDKACEYADIMTSEPGDSWEKLEEDMSLVGCNKALVVGIVTKNEKGRFDCKIDCETCSRLTAEVFIRRAKALAEERK